MRLSGEERFLIILDDVWEKLDLMDIGIPTANNQKGCTTLITARKLDVCKWMSCEEIIPLKGLNKDESWDLFRKHSGLSDDLSNNWKDMAQNILKVCDGLPIAIAAVANTLKNKPYGEWVKALKILRNPIWMDIEEGLKRIYGCLLLSYNNLENEVLKSLFLLCSVYPEDYEIPIDELTMIGLGLGLVGEIPSYWEGTQVINEAIEKLINSCLLQKVSDQYSRGDIKMHDLVRDVAKWIANKENKLIMGPLKEDVIMEDYARIFQSAGCSFAIYQGLFSYSRSNQSVTTLPYVDKGVRNGKLSVVVAKRERLLVLRMTMHLPQVPRNSIPYFKSLTQLEALEVNWNNELRSMFGPSSEDLNPTKPQTIEFPALKRLTLHWLPNIMSICSDNYHPTWSSLKSISLKDCPLLHIKSIIPWVECGGLRQYDNHVTVEDLLKVVVASVESLEDLYLFNQEVEVVFDVEQLSINGQHVNLKLRQLDFVELPQLTHIWRATGRSLFPRPFSLWSGLRNIIESMEDSSEETGGQSNDQKMTIIATTNMTENKKESEDGSAHVWEMSKEKSVEGRVEECTTSENVQIATSLAHSEPTSSTKSVNRIMPALEISTVMHTSSPRPQSISTQSATNPVDISIHQTPSNHVELVNTISTSQSESKCQQQQSLAKMKLQRSIGDLEGQSAQKENISRENDVKGISEGSLSSENAKIIAPSTDSKLATPSTKSVPRIQSQIKFNLRKSDAEDLKEDDLIRMLDSMEDDYGGKSSILFVPTVATTKDELVAKALVDLEESLKMPLKDIATSDANSLRLQTVLNFLSRLSLEDGALSHGVMAVIKSMHKDFPNILSSFKQAFATVNKFSVLEERDKSIKDELTQRKEVAIALVSKMSETQKFMDEAQEKEARLKEKISLLEKQRKDCEVELLSLQEQKRKYIAETVEFKKEIETVRKEKSEMVEDQGNARQQLFQVEYKWSILSSQFEQDTANRNLS
ncbi:hypothetical protein K1719_041122 [Acacia pycnantha]|nr:hypothetical protein K1719_041122 [Acacia pycnantha]